MSLAEKISNYTDQHDLSDFHIRSNQPMAIRVHGSVMLFEDDLISRKEIELFWKESLNQAQLKEIVTTKDLDFAVMIGNYRFRVNGYYSSYGPSMVLRKIVSEIPNIEKLNLPQAVHDAVKHRTGLVLVTGQTGSGKSTSLAAMIDQINTNNPENIVTIEDRLSCASREKSILSQRSWKRYKIIPFGT